MYTKTINTKKFTMCIGRANPLAYVLINRKNDRTKTKYIYVISGDGNMATNGSPLLELYSGSIFNTDSLAGDGEVHLRIGNDGTEFTSFIPANLDDNWSAVLYNNIGINSIPAQTLESYIVCLSGTITLPNGSVLTQGKSTLVTDAVDITLTEGNVFGLFTLN